MIRVHDCRNLKTILDLYRKYPYKEYSYLPLDKDAVDTFEVKRLAKKLTQQQSYLSLDNSSDKPSIFLFFQELDWDSQMFGHKMASLRLYHDGSDFGCSDFETLLADCFQVVRDEDYRMVTFPIDAKESLQVWCAEKAGFNLMTTHITYIIHLNTESFEQKCDDIIVREAVADDVSALREVAAHSSYRYSRFNLESLFTPEKKRGFYAQWVVNSMKGLADKVFIAEKDGQLIGYSTWTIVSPPGGSLRAGVIDNTIGGVLPSYRRLGVFTKITAAGCKHYQELGYHYVLGSINVLNTGCQRTYLNFNATPGRIHHTYHWRSSKVC